MNKEDDCSFMNTRVYVDDVKDCLNIANLIVNKCQNLSGVTTKSLEKAEMDDLLIIHEEILSIIDLIESNKFTHIMKMDESTFLFYKKYKTKINNLLDNVNFFINKKLIPNKTNGDNHGSISKNNN